MLMLAVSLAPVAEDDVTAVIERLDRRSAEITTVRAEFVQVRHSALLRRPLESSGTVRLTRTLSRWDTKEPSPSTTLVGGGIVKLHYPDQKLLEVYDLGEQLGQLGASPLADFEELDAHFSIALHADQDDDRSGDERVAVFRLTPRSEQVAEFVSEVRLDIGLDRALVRRAVIVDRDGERTEISFREVKVNESFADDDLKLELPAGTRTVQR